MAPRLFETLHGHLGVLAAAGLLHPAILLRRGSALSPGARLSVGLTTLAVVLAFGTGAWLYPSYVARVKPGLFQASLRAGLLFETKEHLAFTVLATALAAGAAALLAPREAVAIRRAASWLYAVSAALCLLTVALGSYVASVHGF